MTVMTVIKEINNIEEFKKFYDKNISKK